MLAEKADLSTNFIQQMETSKAFPRPERLDQLSKACNLPVSAFFEPDSDFSGDMRVFEQAAWEKVGAEVEKIIKKHVEETHGKPHNGKFPANSP
jgi:transcriptional regulator with XRE-family HTH domain